MNFSEVVKSRRSTRKFLDKPVSKEVILELLEAAQVAPSAGNCQPWHFYVIQDKSLKVKIQEQAFNQHFISMAPLVFVVCTDFPRTEPRYGQRGIGLYSIQDTAAAIQNMLLCAESLKLSSCWVGAFDESEIAKILNIKEGQRPIAIIPVGYSEHKGKMPKRRSIEEFTTFVGEQ